MEEENGWTADTPESECESLRAYTKRIEKDETGECIYYGEVNTVERWNIASKNATGTYRRN